MEQIEARFAQAGTNPPELDAVIEALRADPAPAQRLFHLLLQRGRLVRIPDGKVFHSGALEDLKRRLWEQRATSPVIDITAFKELSGTSRHGRMSCLSATKSRVSLSSWHRRSSIGTIMLRPWRSSCRASSKVFLRHRRFTSQSHSTGKPARL